MGSALAKIMESKYTVCKIDGLLAFQRELKDYKNLYEINTPELIKAVTRNIKISLNALKKSLNSKAYYFLDIDEEILNNMLSAEKNLKKIESCSEEITTRGRN